MNGSRALAIFEHVRNLCKPEELSLFYTCCCTLIGIDADDTERIDKIGETLKDCHPWYIQNFIGFFRITRMVHDKEWCELCRR